MPQNKAILVKPLKTSKTLILIAEFSEIISSKLAKLFTTPIEHKIPKHEFQMDKGSV